MTNQSQDMAKTIRVILKPLRKQRCFLLSKARSIPEELLPKYQKGSYPKGSARIVNNAIQKVWKTMRSTKQIPLDKEIATIVRKSSVLYLKFQTELIPIRLKEVPDLDELLLNHFRTAVVWLKGTKWVADILVDIEDKYIEGKPEAVIGIDLGQWHNCYSIWCEDKEIYRAFDKFGEYHNTMEKISEKIAILQESFTEPRKELSKQLQPLYERRRNVLRQYYGTLRNQILSHIPEGYNAVFSVEDLDSLPRANLRKRQRIWAHQELANGIFSRAIEWNGYKLIKVDPRGTTHTCWKCGKPVKSMKDRKIICGTCYPNGLDRDLNGARNIARRYMLSCIPQHSCSGKTLDDSYKAMCKEEIIEEK